MYVESDHFPKIFWLHHGPSHLLTGHLHLFLPKRLTTVIIVILLRSQSISFICLKHSNSSLSHPEQRKSEPLQFFKAQIEILLPVCSPLPLFHSHGLCCSGEHSHLGMISNDVPLTSSSLYSNLTFSSGLSDNDIFQPLHSSVPLLFSNCFI